MERDPASAADLVANLAWIQRLALSIARDRHRADDLSQEGARVWLERTTPLEMPARGPKAWLAAVARTLARDRARSDKARQVRERSVARPEREDDPFEVVERGAWQKRVTEAVMELPEPYRSTILYRYLDQLATSEVAARMGVREATVRKRLERALALLRERLGGRADTDSGARKLAGILLMTTKAKVACAAAAFGLVLFLSLRVLPAWIRAEPPVEGAIPERVAAPDGKVADDLAPPAAVAGREADPGVAGAEAAVARIAPDVGALRVHVIWGDDRKPAAGILVALYRDDADPLFECPLETSDEKGEILFSGLRPGRVHARAERGEHSWGEAIAIAAGAETEATIALAPGIECAGIVVDAADRPIEGAEVLVAGWAAGLALPLARTDASGAFALRAVGTHCHVGARAPGFAASPLRQIAAREGARIEVRIVLADEAAKLAGVVLDPQGRPVAGAVVQAGRESMARVETGDGSISKPPTPSRARTDAEGRFAFASVPPGSVPLAVRARELAPWLETVELRAGESREVVAELRPGVTLLGSVRDASGAAVARAAIRVATDNPIGDRIAFTDERGEYRIDGLGDGELELRAEREERGTAATTLTAVAGATLRWDAVLSRGTVLRGRVLDENGDPPKHASVQASHANPASGIAWGFYGVTDESGRFVLEDCVPGEPLRIAITRRSTFPEVVLEPVMPSDEELVVRLPKEAWVHIQGTVLDPDGQAVPGVHVWPAMRGGRGVPAETADPATGAFRYGPYPPGEYRLQLQADGFAPTRVPWRKLAPDEVWDVGTLTLERGGSVLVNLLDASRAPRTCWLSLFDESGELLENNEAREGVARFGPLASGRYLVQLTGERVASRLQSVEVENGAEMRVDVRVDEGFPVEIELALPDGARAPEGVQVVIRDASGGAVMRTTAWSPEGPLGMSAILAPGSYRIEASVDELRGEGACQIAAGGAPPAPTAHVRLR